MCVWLCPDPFKSYSPSGGRAMFHVAVSLLSGQTTEIWVQGRTRMDHIKHEDPGLAAHLVGIQPQVTTIQNGLTGADLKTVKPLVVFFSENVKRIPQHGTLNGSKSDELSCFFGTVFSDKPG